MCVLELKRALEFLRAVAGTSTGPWSPLVSLQAGEVEALTRAELFLQAPIPWLRTCRERCPQLCSCLPALLPPQLCPKQQFQVKTSPKRDYSLQKGLNSAARIENSSSASFKELYFP